MFTFPLIPAPPTTTNAPVVVLVLLVPGATTKFAPEIFVGVELVLVIGPAVVNAPSAAFTVKSPTCSPLCTTKLLFAI